MRRYDAINEAVYALEASQFADGFAGVECGGVDGFQFNQGHLVDVGEAGEDLESGLDVFEADVELGDPFRFAVGLLQSLEFDLQLHGVLAGQVDTLDVVYLLDCLG